MVEKTDDNVALKIVDLMLCHSKEESKLYLEFLSNKIKFREHSLKSLRDDEPCKIFKKKHKDWEMKVEALENEIMDIYKQYGNEIHEIQKINSELNGK